MRISSSSAIPDVKTIIPDRFEDKRGLFSEQFNTETYREIGVDFDVSQINESVSQQGVIRGLHWQASPNQQAKLVRVSHGSILNVAVDIRRGSPTYGKHAFETLSAENGKQVFVPRGFAHGFLSLEDGTVCNFLCDGIHVQESRRGMRYDDPELGIAWPVEGMEVKVSDKDMALPRFLDIEPLEVTRG